MDFRHGTLNGYQRHKCRCDECVTFKREYYRAYKAKRKEEGRVGPHGLDAYISYGCRCDVCRAACSSASTRRPYTERDRARTRRRDRARYEQNPDEVNRRSAERARRINESLPAPNRGKEWTGPELELAARDDLTAAQVAEMLGRSLYAVRTVRHSLREDPVKSNLAGLPRRRAEA